MLKKSGWSTSVAVVAALVATPLQAQQVTSEAALDPSTTITDFGLSSTSVSNGFSALLPGGDNIFMSYFGFSGLFFDFQGWGLVGNGTVTGNSVGINQAGRLRFDFLNGPVGGVGFLMNYATVAGNVFLRAFDASNNLLSEFDVRADAPIAGNPFQFRGIQTAGIASFEIEGTGSVSVIFRSMTFTTVSVPEPGSMSLIAIGLLGLVGVRVRRRREEIA